MPAVMMMIIPMLFSTLLYPLYLVVNTSPMPHMDYVMICFIMSLSVTGAYQLFFFVQQKNHRFKARCFETKLDEYIPFIPQFVWVYSIGYYCFFGLMLLVISSINAGVALLFSGLVQLVIHSVFFFFLPVVTPAHYRAYEGKTVSTRYLKQVQYFDNGRCCFPSLHCSAMMFTSLVLYPTFGVSAFVLLLVITLSCLFVKQHQIIDFVLSFPIGWVVYYFIYLPLHG